ncbi:trypsin-like serine protease [Bacillus mycoides]|uniref:Serine protease n=1 Tax=Bacillus thuringiensis serovar navarrensis TaxID=339658 RepID=A0A243ARB3_BACTU|nr:MULTISPECIES: trypsin-like peptidase domain-containing protein [Bacillus cereus group]MED1269805.1 trypsin-like serine protease [Bacillus mycoides]OTY29939.1 hypothetical protein BK732_01385 [Bacillus thuringiensis serovar navarrensis]
MKLKLFFYLSVFLLCCIPTNFISAETVQDTEEVKESSPYDMIMSNGDVVKKSIYTNSVTKEEYDSAIFENKGNGKGIFMKGTLDLQTIDNFGFLKSKDTPNEVIFGNDNRYIVQNTSEFPYRTISYLRLTDARGSFSCTGTVIGENTVLTNAHCLYDRKTKNYLKSGYVIPGIKDSHYNYGTYSIVDYWLPAGYVNNASDYTQYDFAVVKVATSGGSRIGDAVGYPGIQQVTNLNGTFIKLFGYPSDKITSTGVISQWGHTGYVKADSPNLAFYEIDTYPGQSGSAMLNSLNYVVGVHNGSYDLNENDVVDSNGGVKMTKPVFQFVVSYRHK